MERGTGNVEDFRGGSLPSLKEISNWVVDFTMYVDDVIHALHVIEKMDSGASSNMSGADNRIVTKLSLDDNIKIVGFNGAASSPVSVGLNSDGKREYFVPSMPENLALLSAHSYAQDGAVILLGDGGVVLQLTPSELTDLKQKLSRYRAVKALCVRNRTYEVCPATAADCTGSVLDALSNTAVRFFNTKVNVSNASERILTMLMTGLSFRDLYSHVSNGSLEGMPPDLTLSALNHYEHKYGVTPEFIRLAIARNPGHRTGLMTQRLPLSYVGERYEIDCMEADVSNDVASETSSKATRSRKLLSHGGAIAGAVGVDCFSGFVHGKLLKSTGNSITFVSEFIARVELEGWHIGTLAADSGVMTQSIFQVLTPAVEALCLANKPVIRPVRSEPYDHSLETGTVENAIGIIKRLMSLAEALILRNPNFNVTGFTKLEVLKLWGEFFNWAITVLNLKPCPQDPTRTRYEVFMSKKPNMQNIRILPIGAIVLAYRRVGLKGASNVVGIYVGPSLATAGCARIAVKVGGTVKILTTSHFSAASDGGGLNVFPTVARGLQTLLTDQLTAVPPQADVFLLSDPEHDTVSNSGFLVPPSGQDSGSNTSLDDDTLSSPISTMPGPADVNSMLFQPDPVHEHPVISSSLENDNAEAVVRDASTFNLVVPDALPSDGCTLNSFPESEPLPLRRSARQRDRRARRELVGLIAQTSDDLETSCFADWSTHNDNNVYWSFCTLQFMQISCDHQSPEALVPVADSELGFVAVTENVPKTFSAALRDPLWGDAARLELNTLIATGAIVEIEADLAKNALKCQGADLVLLFPVYEKKIKEGLLVYKVRLVGDGRTHYHAGVTYSATPSREELLILLHVAAGMDWHYVHLDEKRAFLKAPYKGDARVFTKLRDDSQFYEVLGALYGLKTAPRDYQDFVFTRLTELGFTRLMLCSCIYVLTTASSAIILYDFVDDFIVFGNSRSALDLWVAEFRKSFDTTEPIWNSASFLGLEVHRHWEKHLITVTMQKKIEEVCGRFGVNSSSPRHDTPMPLSGYIIKDSEFDNLPHDLGSFLDARGRLQYLAVVGGLLWIAGIRHDILFAVLYMTWSTKQPRHHHMKMALYTLSYLFYTSALPLVLGGYCDLFLTGYTDASLGTAPKGRSVISSIEKLHPDAGAIAAKCRATSLVHTASFAAELDGTMSAMKHLRRIENVLTELGLRLASVPQLWSDNEAMIKFVQGAGTAKGVRHMELRMWYVRERYMSGGVVLDYMSGITIPTDKLTKLGCKASHIQFTRDILGLKLLE